MKCRIFSSIAASALFFVPSAFATPVFHNISAGWVEILHPWLVDTNLAEANLLVGTYNFQVGPVNRADYSVRAGAGFESVYDVERGVLMTCVAENGRDNFGTNAYATSCFTMNGGGSYRIVTAVANLGEYNVNVAGAWFPYANYLGGYAYNSGATNGGVNDSFIGSPGLVLGTHFKSVASGKFIVDLRGLGIDSRTDGVLLVNHAKEEANYALSQANTTDGTWNVFVRDIAQSDFNSYEQDPVAFVFIPKTNTMVVSGKFLADGTIAMHSGTSAQFSVTSLGTGRWGLQIAGGSPTNGVLIISPEGGGSLNADNIVNYEPVGSGWEIESRDTPANGLQTPTGEPVVSFVYVPAATPGVTLSRTNNLTTSGPGTTATFDVTLHSRPRSEVTIPLSSTDSGKGIPALTSVKLTPATWHLPHTVTVAGQNDPPTPTNATFSILLSPAISSDAGYNGINPADVDVAFAPPRAVNVAPTNGNQIVGISPLLQVAVTNGTPEGLTVQVYGREAPTNYAGPDFTIAVLPDTQMYTAEKGGGTRYMFISQCEWIITNRISRNIAYVTQLGDIINDGDVIGSPAVPNTNQWWNATNAMYRLENPVRTQLPHGMPYGVAVGNHEMEPIGDPTGTTIYYNQYFGVHRFLGRSYYAGHYGTNNNNHYDFFSASGLDFVVVYFEYDPAPPAGLLGWANDILRTNANRRAIIVTHNMGNTATPVVVSTQWTAIYNALKTNANLFMMLGGHVTGQGSRVDTYNGNDVYTFVQDYQGWAYGGNGYMRLFEFSPSNNVVVAQTYSPWIKEWLTDEFSEFYFPYQMSPGTPQGLPWTTLATTNAVAPGSVVGLAWPSLEAGKTYEWYVRVTDSTGKTTISPVWAFTTTSNNLAPIVVSKLVTIMGDSSTNLTLTATDPNNDVLTFQILTAPTKGLMQNFDPAAGTFTYTPARGYRGSDPMAFRVSDGQATSSTATWNLMVAAPADSDFDGLPDEWEIAYDVSDPNADEDADGENNMAEYAANTNPTNSASVLRITGAETLTNGFFGLSWDSVGGTRYRVQFSNGKGVDAPFTDIVRNLASEMDSNAVGVAGTQTFVDDLSLTGPATNNARYYRVRVAQ